MNNGHVPRRTTPRRSVMNAPPDDMFTGEVVSSNKKRKAEEVDQGKLGSRRECACSFSSVDY